MPNIVAFTGSYFIDDEGNLYAPYEISYFKLSAPVAVDEVNSYESSYEESYTDE